MDTESVPKYHRQSKEGSPPLRNKAFKRTLFRNRFLIRIGVMSKYMIRILKILSFVFNVFLAIGGMTMVIVAGYAMKYLLSSDWITEKEATPTIILLTIGIFLIIATAFGVIACFKESPTILIIFIVFLTGATIAEIVVGLMAGRALNDYREYSLSELRSATKVYIGSDRHSRKIDQLQYKCCGIEEPSSWSSTFKYPQMPKSCCKNNVDQSVCQISEDGSNIYQEGCWMKLIKTVENHERNVMAISMVVALLQILAVIINVCLAFGIFRQRQWKTVIVSAFKEGNESAPKEEDIPVSAPTTAPITSQPTPKKVKPSEENNPVIHNIFSKKTKDQIESKINLIPPSINKKKEENSPKNVSLEIKHEPINPKSKTDIKNDSKQYPHTPINPKSKTNIFENDPIMKSPVKEKDKRKTSK